MLACKSQWDRSSLWQLKKFQNCREAESKFKPLTLHGFFLLFSLVGSTVLCFCFVLFYLLYIALCFVFFLSVRRYVRYVNTLDFLLPSFHLVLPVCSLQSTDSQGILKGTITILGPGPGSRSVSRVLELLQSPRETGTSTF